MSALLINLRDVPDDETDDLRGLLERHNIAFVLALMALPFVCMR